MGQTLQLARRKYMAKGCFDDQKKKMERDKRFFPEVLSQMINNDVDAWEVKFFIRITTKYVINIPINFSPYARSIVKSSSRNGLNMLHD